MTRIITEHYPCGNCGATLARPCVTSVFVYSGVPFSNEGIRPKVYLCEDCGYVGYDLSEPPSEEIRAILESEEYRFFFAHTFRNDEAVFFLMGYLRDRLGQYEDAAYWFCRSCYPDAVFKWEKEWSRKEWDRLMESSELDFELLMSVYDQEGDLGCLYLREWIYDCVKKYPFEESSPLLFVNVVDALRKGTHFCEAIDLIDARIQKEVAGDDLPLLERERLLCTEKKAAETLDLPPLL